MLITTLHPPIVIVFNSTKPLFEAQMSPTKVGGNINHIIIIYSFLSKNRLCYTGSWCHLDSVGSLWCVTFCTTDSTPSPSPLKMLCRRIVDHHHYQSYAPFAHPDNSHTSLCPPAPYYMWKHLYPIFNTSYVNGLCSTHVYLLSILEYGHAWSKYHMFSFPCHMFVLFFHMPLLIIPHATSYYSTCHFLLFHMPLLIIPHATSYYSTCYFQVFHMLVALCYPLCFIPSVYKHWVPVLYFLSFEYQI